MDVLTTYSYNSISVTTNNGLHEVQFAVQCSEEDRKESVSVSVIVPDLPSQSIGDIQKAALRRAMEILQSALLHPK